MFIWRSLSPKAILDCIDYLLPRPEKGEGAAGDLGKDAQAEEAQCDAKQQIDQHIINERLEDLNIFILFYPVILQNSFI